MIGNGNGHGGYANGQAGYGQNGGGPRLHQPGISGASPQQGRAPMGQGHGHGNGQGGGFGGGQGHNGGGHNGGGHGGGFHSHGTASPSWVVTGAAGAQVSQRVAQEQAQHRQDQQERRQPHRFFLRQSPGQTGRENIGTVVILDREPGPRYWEHMMRGPNSRFPDTPEICPKTYMNCPLCANDTSSFVMLLTVLNLDGYVDKQTGQHVHPTREILAIKNGQGEHAIFDRMFQNYGTLRGLQLTLVRQGQKSPRTGVIDPATPPVQHSEQDITNYLQQMGKMGPLFSTRDNRELEPAGYMAEPFDYARFLKEPDVNRLIQLYGGGASPMSNYGGGQDQGQWGQPGMGQNHGGGHGMGQPGMGGGMGQGQNPGMGHGGGFGGNHNPGTAQPPGMGGGMGGGHAPGMGQNPGMGQGHDQGQPQGDAPPPGMTSQLPQEEQGEWNAPGNAPGNGQGAQTGAPDQQTTTAPSQEGATAQPPSGNAPSTSHVQSRSRPGQHPEWLSQHGDQSGGGQGGGQAGGQGGMNRDLDDEIPF